MREVWSASFLEMAGHGAVVVLQLEAQAAHVAGGRRSKFLPEGGA